MISPAYLQTMATYNAAMNRRLYDAAARLPPSDRHAPRGGFWGSIHGTLTHIVWADIQWMSRFDNGKGLSTPLSRSGEFIEDFAELRALREKTDADILRWADALDDTWLHGDLVWFSAAAQREICAPKQLLVMHFFNHQTHHRGQAHAMLTAAGETTGDTDLFLVLPGMR